VISSLVSDLGGLLWTIGSFVVALGIIVAVHEYGHYIIGRWTGIKADVFSLGFGPVLASRMDRHGTRWQVAAIPLGGFVRFRGDRDAASAQAADVAGLSAAEARQTMAGAPVWARVLTVAAGPFFNFVLAFVIFVGLLLVSGLPSDRVVVGKLHPMPIAQDLMLGDEVVALNGVQTPDPEAFFKAAASVGAAPTASYTVLRGARTLDVTAPNPLPARVDTVHLQSAAFDAGLRIGDVVLRVDGAAIQAFSQLPDLVEASGGAPLTFDIWRPGTGELSVILAPNRRDLPTADGSFETRWLIGLSSGPLFDPPIRSVGVIEAAQIALKQVRAVFTGTFSGMVHMIRGEISTCNLSGPVGLADTMGEAARTGLQSFVTMVAMISMGVGILNLLPIPVLDGGHLVFYAYEAIAGRKPNPRVLNLAVMVGLFLVAALTIFALGNDLTCA
jgi:regulator of sigma E protease